MRSKTSCFNGTLFRKNLSRYWPLWGLASFGGAMFPLAMLLELLHNGFRFWSPLETRQAYYTVLSYGVPVISIVYAILCAMAVWSYLYNARSVGMMHTLRAYNELEAEGYIYSVAGKGSFVSGTADADAARRETLRADVKKLLNELRYLGVTEADAAALIKEVYEQ